MKKSIPEDLWKAFFQGDRLACARLITIAENRKERVPELRDALANRLGRAVRIGITGPPGVGKSTLTSLLALGMADAGHKVGIVAVDPSSPFSGGAFMGDRVRMEGLVGDQRIYMRSLASREGHGGLSPSTPDVADVLEGFGMDRILIETVGVGQAELDVLECTDLVVLVLQPSTGDAIQTMKAGIIEAADLIVVNKADLPGKDVVLNSLRFLFGMGLTKKIRPVPPVMTTSAMQNEGLPELVAELEKLASVLLDSGRHADLRRARMEKEIREAISQCLWTAYDGLTGATKCIQEKARELVEKAESPYPFIRESCSRVRVQALDKEASNGHGA